MTLVKSQYSFIILNFYKVPSPKGLIVKQCKRIILNSPVLKIRGPCGRGWAEWKVKMKTTSKIKDLPLSKMN